MKYTLTVKSSELGDNSYNFTTEQEYPIRFTSFGLDVSVNKISDSALPEFQVSFVPSKEIKLNSVTVTLPFAENVIGDVYPMYMYDNSLCTNSFASIKEITLENADLTRSREIVTVKSGKGNLNAAFTSFERFYTEFQTDGKSIVAFYALEDKAVKVGENYELESLVIDDNLSGLEFFEKYTEMLHNKYNIGPMKPIPAGWSSWSCLYGEVTEEHVIKQSKLLADKFLCRGADLVQIDDGWQKDGSFGAHWTVDEKQFGTSIPILNDKIRSFGLRMGLWLAPGLVVDESDMFEELNDCLLKKDGKLIKSFGGDDAMSATKNGSVYSMDLGNEKTLQYVRDIFTRCKNEYGAGYFKIDFVMNLMLRLILGGERVEYEDGYLVELYRKFVREIRATVGDEVFLLACGSPVGESIGVFDSIRISPDITWAGASNPGHPGEWFILKGDAQSAFLRSPFHNKVFINDPDALLVRDYLTDKTDDGFALNYEEAKMWSTVVAMSGGHILLNEEIDRLTEERQELFTQILPPLGLAARPRDFYEYPWCSETFIEADRCQLVALYNWGEEELTKCFKNPFGEQAIMIDCWSKNIIGVVDGSTEFTLPAHTCRAFLIRPLKDGFLYSDGNFYLGLGIRYGKEYYYYQNAAPAGYTKIDSDAISGIYTKD